MGEINSKTKYYTQNESDEWVEVAEAKTISQLEEQANEERMEKENYVPRFVFYSQKEQYEKYEIMGIDLADMRGEEE